jgi:hypothetical protein
MMPERLFCSAEIIILPVYGFINAGIMFRPQWPTERFTWKELHLFRIALE